MRWRGFLVGALMSLALFVPVGTAAATSKVSTPSFQSVVNRNFPGTIWSGPQGVNTKAGVTFEATSRTLTMTLVKADIHTSTVFISDLVAAQAVVTAVLGRAAGVNSILQTGADVEQVAVYGDPPKLFQLKVGANNFVGVNPKGDLIFEVA